MKYGVVNYLPSIKIMWLINNLIIGKQVDVVTHTYPNFNIGLIDQPAGHGRLITYPWANPVNQG